MRGRTRSARLTSQCQSHLKQPIGVIQITRHTTLLAARNSILQEIPDCPKQFKFLYEHAAINEVQVIIDPTEFFSQHRKKICKHLILCP